MDLEVIVDLVATQPHYLDHLAPVWHALADDDKGSLVISEELKPRAKALGLRAYQFMSPSTEHRIALTAGWRDAVGARTWGSVVLMEHGVGQTYEGVLNQSYAGTPARSHVVDLFLCPNERVKRANLKADPDAKCEVIGSTYLDWLRGHTILEPDFPKPAELGVSFHYDGGDVVPEAGSGFNHFRSAVAAFDNGKRTIVVTSHPRAWQEHEPWWQDHNVPFTQDLVTVLAVCKVFACDNSSALFYACALGRPVVVLNPPQYRHEVEHGLRFWEHAGIGVNCSDPTSLAETVACALPYPDEREAMMADLFPLDDGQAAKRAAEAIQSLHALPR